MEGEMARFSATAASAKRPRALRGGVEESLGRLASPEVLDKADDAASRFRSEGNPEDVGLSKVAAVLDSPTWPLEPKAMKSPGGGWPKAGKWKKKNIS